MKITIRVHSPFPVFLGVIPAGTRKRCLFFERFHRIRKNLFIFPPKFLARHSRSQRSLTLRVEHNRFCSTRRVKLREPVDIARLRKCSQPDKTNAG